MLVKIDADTFQTNTLFSRYDAKADSTAKRTVPPRHRTNNDTERKRDIKPVY